MTDEGSGSRVGSRIASRLGEIRPARVRPGLERRRVYASALIGMALLLGLAWLNNAGRIAVAALVALALGLFWIAYEAHRAVLTTVLAIAWWAATAPALGVVSSAGLPPDRVYPAISSAVVTNAGLGVVVLLGVVLSRAPRPGTTVLLCWIVNLVVVVATSYVVPGQAWLAGYLLTAGILTHRVGLLSRLRRRSVRLGAIDPDDTGRMALRAALGALREGYRVRYDVALADGAETATVVVGPTGTHVLAGVFGPGLVRPVSRGRRLVLGDRRLDPDVVAVARLAAGIGRRLRTPTQPMLVVMDAEFPDELVRVMARTGRGEPPQSVLVVRGDLAAHRIGFGPSVLTAGQVSRVERRLARPAVGA